MKGEHEVIVRTNRLQYKFSLKRNITILRGNSATGKTTLIDLIEQHQNNKNGSGVTINCDKNCVVLTENNWQLILSATKDSLVFIDEGVYFLNTVEFARAIKNSNNYYCISVRDTLPLLPYSPDEVYTIKNITRGYGQIKRVYSCFKRIYSREDFISENIEKPDVVIVEDSNSGFQFFKNYFDKFDIECLSANGNSNIAKEVLKLSKEKCVLVIADGAAFGSQIEKLLKIKLSRKVILYLPESFEWLILDSGLIKSTEIEKVLEKTSDFVESSEFFSWEQFFTYILKENTKTSYLKYEKSILNKSYLQEKEQNQIIKRIPDFNLWRNEK